MPENKILKAQQEVKKVFSYALGNITFSVTVRTDIKQEMKDMLEILAKAQVDVKEELAKK
ncbi:MAG: hypothetical protein WC499_02570 [Patescibacteria group bacterium]